MPHVQGFVMEDGLLPKRRKKKFKELTEVQEVPEEEQKEDSADQPSVEAQGMNKTPKNKSTQRAPEEMLSLNPFYQMNLQNQRIEQQRQAEKSLSASKKKPLVSSSRKRMH